MLLPLFVSSLLLVIHIYIILFTWRYITTNQWKARKKQFEILNEHVQKSLKIPNRKSEAISWRTDNTMVTRIKNTIRINSNKDRIVTTINILLDHWSSARFRYRSKFATLTSNEIYCLLKMVVYLCIGAGATCIRNTWVHNFLCSILSTIICIFVIFLLVIVCPSVCLWYLQTFLLRSQ